MVMHLPPDLEASIRRRVASGQFGDETEVIRKALDALDEREQEQLTSLRVKIRSSFDQTGGVEVTSDLMDELERESEERYRRDEQPGPDVIP